MHLLNGGLGTKMFDLQSAQRPQLLPLVASHEPRDYRTELKELTLNLFANAIADKAFDANVLGMAHLGSLELIRQFMYQDGLALLVQNRADEILRYLYRAWKKKDRQGRGLHFLRLYLRLLFGNAAEVKQLWCPRTTEYTADNLGALVEDPPDQTGYWLTSRIKIYIDAAAVSQQQQSHTALGGSFIDNQIAIIESIIPARLVPVVEIR